MRFRYVIMLGIVLLLIVPLPVQAQGVWTVTVGPSIAINNGDNVTIEVRGTPQTYVGINILRPGDGGSMEFLYIITSDEGTGTLDWPVPIDAPSGFYTVQILDGGENVTWASMQIVYDRVSYVEHLLKEQGEQLEQQKGQVVVMGRYVEEVNNRLTWITAAAVSSVVFLFIVAWHDISHYRGYKKWVLDKENHQKLSIKGLSKLYLMFRDPPPDGFQGIVNPGLDDRITDEVERLSGRTPAVPLLFMPDALAQGGYRVYPAKDADNEASSEEDEEAEPEEVVMDLKKEDAKRWKLRKERTEGPSSIALFFDRLHFIRNCKLARIREIADVEDEEEQAEEIPVQPTRTRRRPEPMREPVFEEVVPKEQKAMEGKTRTTRRRAAPKPRQVRAIKEAAGK